MSIQSTPTLNLDDLLAAQQTAIKAVSELRRVIAELDAARAALAELQKQQAQLQPPPEKAGSSEPPTH